MSTRNFHQQKYTVAQSLERKTMGNSLNLNLVDHKYFYKVSDNRIMMAVCRNDGKNKGKYDVVYYNGVLECDTFVIRDAEPVDDPIWFDNEDLFNEFIKKEGLSNTRFTPFRTQEELPRLEVDDTIPRLWEEFKELDKEHIRKGCWNAVFIDKSTDETFTTQGDICKNTSWKDYFEWLVGDIEEVIDGELSDIEIIEVYYDGIDDAEYFAN